MAPPGTRGTRRWRWGNILPLPGLLLWQSLALLWLAGLCCPHWQLPALTVAGLIFWADARLWHPARALGGVCAFLAGVCVMYGALPRPAPAPDWLLLSPPPRLCGTVDTVQGLPDQRLRVLLSGVRPLEGAAPPLPGLLVWTWEQPTLAPLPGQRVAVSLKVLPVQGNVNPGTRDFSHHWQGKGVFWRLWSRGGRGEPHLLPPADPPGHPTGTPRTGEVWRAKAREALLDALRGCPGFTARSPATGLTQGQAFLPALLLGDRSCLDSDTVRRMSAAALVHSLALSGQHLALASLLGLALAWLAGLCLPGVYLRLPRLKWALALSLAPALCYVWLGGGPASLWRACAMLLLLSALLWKNVSFTVLDLLLGALVAITLVHPASVLDTGLQLSALCVAALGLSLPLARALPRRAPGKQPAHTLRHGLARLLAQVLLASLCIQLALLPVTLTLFHTVSPWFLLNLLWLPLLGLWVMPLGALGACCLAFWPGLGQALLTLASAPCNALLALLTAMDNAGLFAQHALLRPHWTSLPGWGALMVALGLLPGRPHLPPAGKRLLCAAAVLLLVGPVLRGLGTLDGGVSLDMLDVGQGQAVCLTLPGGERLLIDGGGSASPRFDTGRDIVSPHLSYNRAPRLQGLFSSHPDLDHMRGLGHILRTWDVRHIHHNGASTRNQHPDMRAIDAILHERGTALHAGQELALPGGLRLEVLHPPPNSPLQGNDRSLVLRLTRAGHGLALIPGDLEREGLRQLLASGRDLHADVLVLPHHGSRGSLSPALYDAVRPRVALVSHGAHNRYHYPNAPVCRALHERGIPLYGTARNGALRVYWPGGPDAREPRVAAARGAPVPETAP